MDRVYRLPCYRAALEALPVDVRTYSSAEDDIRRALLYAQIHKPNPGRRPAAAVAARSRTVRAASATASRPGPPRRSSVQRPDRARAAVPRIDHAALPVPLPLIALAAVSTFLLGVGSVGFLARRIGARFDGN